MECTNKKEVRMLCIGMGKHFMNSHLPIFYKLKEKYSLKIVGCVEKQERIKDVEEKVRALFPEVMTFLKVKKDGFCEALSCELDVFVKKNKITVITISVPPEMQADYLKWAANKDMYILCEKPLHIRAKCGISVEDSVLMYDEIMQLYRICSNAKNITIFTQRRKNMAYELLKEQIKAISNYTGCPITNVIAFHNDGQFFFPKEYYNETYHGYELGFGKLAHTGYHLVDICVHLLKESMVSYNIINKVMIQVSITKPKDIISLLSNTTIRKIFKDYYTEDMFGIASSDNYLNDYGEVDIHIIYTFLHDEIVISTQQLCLLHSGLSQRNPEDSMQAFINPKGRIKQEEIVINVGPFFYGKVQRERGEKRKTDLKSYKTKLVMQYNEYIKKRLEITDCDRDFFNEFSKITDDRIRLIEDFFEVVIGKKSICESSLNSHLCSLKLFALTYKAIAMNREGQGKNLLETFILE